MPAASHLLLEQLVPVFDALQSGADPVLRPSDRTDFQINGALALAKRLGRNPRELAEEIAASLRDRGIATIASELEVAGPGFINVTLADSFITSCLGAIADEPRLGIEPVSAHTFIVDYSSPNVAKEMHVGHLRGTIIGDAIVRILTFLGHTVIRENHIGDWGTPFGMLIEYLIDVGETTAVDTLSVGDLDAFYKAARAAFDADPALQARSRARVVLLQSGDAETLRLWRILVAQSITYFDTVYRRLEVLLDDGDVMGESAYNDLLDGVVADLDAAGLLVESDGAKCVFPPGFTNREGEPLPLIIRKSDDGYGYAATDLACIRDRVGRLGADRLLYVVGADQNQHLEMCYSVAKMADWLGGSTQAVHLGFGNMLGQDHKKFKTRSGESIKLIDLLDEAIERAAIALRARGDERDPDDELHIATALGIGAVKYADLSTERMRDYVFDWDRMLAFEGNTGPYLIYAHARICSILRRTETGELDLTAPLDIEAGPERALSMALLGFADALGVTAGDYLPSKLCAYLFDLAQAFTTFYEHCPVLKAPDAQTRARRLVLSDLTRRTLALGLTLLGIEPLEQM